MVVLTTPTRETVDYSATARKLLASVNWILTPEKALHWLRIMLVLPDIWLGMTLWGWLTLRSLRQVGSEYLSAASRYFVSGSH